MFHDHFGLPTTSNLLDCVLLSQQSKQASNTSAFPARRALIWVSFLKQVFIRLSGTSFFLEDSIPLSDLGISLSKSSSIQGMDKYQVERGDFP